MEVSSKAISSLAATILLWKFCEVVTHPPTLPYIASYNVFYIDHAENGRAGNEDFVY